LELRGGAPAGDLDALFDATYGALRRLAGKCFQNERGGITVQPTDLVHEAYVRLAAQPAFTGTDRLTFLGYAARIMRQVLVDEARRRSAHKRGGGAQRITLVDEHFVSEPPGPALLDLHDALSRLERIDRRKALIVQLRFFSGLSIEEVAELTGISVATVNRAWRAARAWLGRELAS
jgi:RNA polymerase sigma factor (TIGR02999 family)